MAIIPSDNGVIVVPTGSLSFEFKLNGETAPADITIEATNSAAETVTFEGLSLITDPADEWQIVQITTPLAFDDVYDVEVLFDDVSVHTENLEIPAPGKRRSRVLRQRIYEILSVGYLTGDIAAKPYGNGVIPSSIAQDFKSESGSFVEVGAAYVDGLERPEYKTQNATVAVPINLYGGMDDPNDCETVAGDMEEVMGYLMAAQWKLNRFGVDQTGATYTAQEPEISEDRKMAVIRGTLSIPMRKVI